MDKAEIMSGSMMKASYLNLMKPVRVTHLPTGLSVLCDLERLEYKNKDKALQFLKSKLIRHKFIIDKCDVTYDLGTEQYPQELEDFRDVPINGRN